MTPTDTYLDGDRANDRNLGDASDRMFEHHRQQLSALVDGELSADEARFLLRRLEHDGELLGCWDRWHFAGDVLRGRHDRLAAPGLVAGVAMAIAKEQTAPTAGNHRRWLRWGGGAALAASTAMIALLLARQTSDVAVPAPNPSSAVATTSSPPALPTRARDTNPITPAPTRSTELVSVMAVADVPRRLIARRARGQSQRAAFRGDRAVARAQVTTGDVASSVVTAVDPFSGQHISLQNRPWPHALLPASPTTGAFTVDYGRRSLPPPTVYPFAPREPDADSSESGH
jgi:hypothetical protein